ncbi:hypothetical protein [Nostoc sp.]
MEDIENKEERGNRSSAKFNCGFGAKKCCIELSLFFALPKKLA